MRGPEIEADTIECQRRGKTVLLSIGGAITEEIGYETTDKGAARTCAQSI